MSKEVTYKNILDNGYSIWLPFVLNSQQKNVISQINDFVNSPDEFAMTISGWAGTGKTTLMEIVAKRYYGKYVIHFAATTHKAAGVLKEKVKKKVFTVNSLFGIMIETDMEGENYDVSKKARKMSDDKVKPGSIIIIDEASMLSIQNYIDVIKKAKERQCKIIFIGDSAQLSPVNEDEISIVFRITEHHKVELTRVMRTDDNAILNEATAIRTGEGFTYQSNVDNDGNGVKYISANDAKTIIDVIDTHMDGLKDNPNYFRVLTYTNNNVENLNLMIRKKIGYDVNTQPQIGEPLMAYANWGYIGMGVSGAQYTIVNSESYNVINIDREYDTDVRNMITYIPDVELDDYKLHVIDLEIEDSLGESVIIPYVDVRNNPHNREIVFALAQEKIYQWNRYRQCENKMDRIKCLDKINAIDNFLLVNDNIYDKDILIQSKVIAYGYAHTIHKSQGSTFVHVLINDNDIDKCKDSKVKKQLRYVALTRAQKSASIITSHKI